MEEAQSSLQIIMGASEASKSRVFFIDQMKGFEDELDTTVPKTVGLAARLLEIAAIILTTRANDPDSVLSEGPALEILRNVRDALQCSPESTLIGEGQYISS